MKGVDLIIQWMKPLFVAIFSVFLAISIYFFTRSPNLLLYQWLDLYSWVDFEKVVVPAWMHWFVYSLPDGLWIFSFTSILFILQSSSSKVQKLLIGGVVLSIGLVHEFGQAIYLFVGTFDWLDLVTYVVFWLIAFHLYFHKGGVLK